MVILASAAYTYNERYFLRFIPLPLSMAGVINDVGWLLPSSQTAVPLGDIDLGNHDLKTEEGLRKTLNAIQDLSPFDNANGMPNYDDINFVKWLGEITSKPFFCTDGTQLFILAAWKQGLAAREWHLLPAGWPRGQGHSVAEFYNPSAEKWQLVDAQHAAIVRGPDGQTIDMVTALRAYNENRNSDIKIDYGSYRERMLNGARGASTEQYFFESGLLKTPVLQLRSPTWLANVPRNFGLSGHFVIGYPIVMDGWSHDPRVWLTKVSTLLIVLFGGIATIILIARFRRSRAGKLSS